MSLRILFVEQVSPDVETCTRCAVLQRTIPVIWPGTRYLAMMDGEDEMDEAPRVCLCETCAMFVRDAISEQPCAE
jgi:hypothetical protein